MEFTILARVRVALAIAVGGVVLGFLGWGFVAPSVPAGAVTFFNGDIGIVDMLICAVLAFAVGFVAYFAAYPYGKQIGVLAVPGGLAVLAIRGGDMTSLIRLNSEVAARQAVYGALKWESLFWLALVLIGFLGVYVAQRIKKPAKDMINENITSSAIKDRNLRIGIALVATVVAAMFLIGILAQDVRIFDKNLGSVVSQPGNGQVGFAVFVAFMVMAWGVKHFLDISYVIPVIAGAILSFVALKFYVNQGVLEYFAENWAVSFYPKAICAILPVQMVAFSALGSVAGYWLAIKIKHDSV